MTSQAVPEGFDREVGPGGLELRARAVAHADEVRAEGTDDEPRITGYGSVSGVATTIDGWFSSWDEEVAEGAWAKTIKEGDIRSTLNHDVGRLLGRTKSGTLTLSEDDTGLRYDIEINPADPLGMSAYAQVKRQDVDGSSVWFRVIAQKWEQPTDENGLERPKRTILEGALYEVGPVVFPAFETTTADARSMDELDSVLRAVGVSDNHRRARLASQLLGQSDAAEELRDILKKVPVLRSAVEPGEDRAADEAPADERPPLRHLSTRQRKTRAIGLLIERKAR